ncbi:MAG TPA: FlgD immunoglobulin-like domain containing protein [bacterium]|nr:FlgD immunoglobulin-like domain containing protein [bacterium]HQI47296.1 FlgD immunoglobulin-like domain containing protein [bacterium]HQJ63783.1 FlgD immunoglobulin-like domain containing protein [bacterium]
MKRHFVLLISLLLAATGSATRISIYEAGYPQNRDDNVRVEEVTDVVRTRGIYIEHQLHLSFAYDFNSWFFTNYNELELEWTFQMPEEVTLFNLFYWKEDSVCRAMLLDKWTAQKMFDEKSSPTREPALLTRGSADQNGQVQYTLRLFPITRFTKCRIMIQYLVPARPSSGRLRTWLPLPQLTTETGGAKTLRLLYLHADNPDSVAVVGLPGITFTYYARDKTWEAELPIASLDYAELILPSPIQGEYYLSVYRKGDEAFYNLAVYPPPLASVHQPRKILILVDFNPGNSSGLSSDLLLTSLKETMERALTRADSASVILTFTEPVFGNRAWQGCSQQNIDRLFKDIWGRRFYNVNLSQELLAAAASFIQANGQGEILWITNRADFPAATELAAQYAREIAGHFPAGTPIHVLDLENTYRLVYYPDFGYGNSSYTFLSELTRITGGNLFFYRYHPLKTALAALFFDKVMHYKEVEVQTRMQNGYTYDRQNHARFEGYYPLDFPVIQTGRFQGVFPMTVTVIGSTLETVVKKEILIPESAADAGTEHLATAHYGHQIGKMARWYQNNALIENMIALSTAAGILSPYTAFIIPDDPTSCYVPDFIDDTRKGSSGADLRFAMQDTLLGFSAAPNPFNPQTTFTISLPAVLAERELAVNLYNLRGQRVRQLRLAALQPGRYQISWDGCSDAGVSLASGKYFAVLQAGQQRKTLPLILLK